MFYELPVQFSFYKRQTDYSTKFLLFMNKKPVNLACDETLLTHKKGTWELDSMYWLCIQKCVAQAKLKLEKTGKGGWEILCLDIIGGARRWLTQDTLTHNQFMNFSQIKMYDISQVRPLETLLTWNRSQIIYTATSLWWYTTNFVALNLFDTFCSFLFCCFFDENCVWNTHIGNHQTQTAQHR